MSKAAHAAVFVLVCGAWSCDRGGAAVAPPVPAADREQEARRAYEMAIAAPMPDKVDQLRRVVARYPDASTVGLAHLALVLYLRMDPRETSMRPAFEAARKFAERRPRDLRVSEAFKLVAQRLIDDGALGVETDELWRKWLEARIAEGADDRGELYAELANAHLYRRRWSDCDAAWEKAFVASAAGPLSRRITAAVTLADLRGRRLGRASEARDMWATALIEAPTREESRTVRAMHLEAVLSHLTASELGAVNAVLLRPSVDPQS